MGEVHREVDNVRSHAGGTSESALVFCAALKRCSWAWFDVPTFLRSFHISLIVFEKTVSSCIGEQLVFQYVLRERFFSGTSQVAQPSTRIEDRFVCCTPPCSF